MDIKLIAQPYVNAQLGRILIHEIEKTDDPIKAVTLVSAFVGRVTLFRFKTALFKLHAAGVKVRVVVGVDMGGTSKEALKELQTWPFDVYVYKNKRSGITFHPKIYTIEKTRSAEIFIGSNNLTDGGMFRNYEGACRITYSLPIDNASLCLAKEQLSKFLSPEPPIGKVLDKEYLEKLLLRNDVPSEAEVRKRNAAARVGQAGKKESDDIFGSEATPGIAPLPLDYQKVVLAANAHEFERITKERRQKKTKSKEKTKPVFISAEPVGQLATPTSFYMELNATKGSAAAKGKKSNIPGEQRIPLEAIWSAKDFWGWQDNYTESVNPRKGDKPKAKEAKPGEDRVYHNWYAKWRISEVGRNDHQVEKSIRMYFYENSSDFRVTSSDLAKWGDPGDIIRVTRLDGDPVDFVCELAKAGTAEHAEWRSLCTTVGRSKRGYGFA